MEIGTPPEEGLIKQHFFLTQLGPSRGRSVYLLLCNGAPVTVRSQQVRALNLAWALRKDLEAGIGVAVIGGGAAGVTFAAVAAKLGAKVHLFEASELMHLQVGCRHRPLHPEIYTWPDATAFRPVSHLPVLGWTTGSAHDVAMEVVSKFQVIQREVNGRVGSQSEVGNRLAVTERARATLARDGALKVNGVPHPDEVSIVVLAVGFGVEDGPDDLPFNSYWRVDALDQSFLGVDRPTTIVVCGAGDGALVEVLRACVQEPDHGPLWDMVLAVTLRYPGLLAAIRKFSSQDFPGEKVGCCYRDLEKNYPEPLREIDKLLTARKRPHTAVRWLFRGNHPFDDRSLPINRFLASRLMALAEKKALQLVSTARADRVTVSPIKGGRYLVEYEIDGTRQAPAGRPWSAGVRRSISPDRGDPRSPPYWRASSACSRTPRLRYSINLAPFWARANRTSGATCRGRGKPTATSGNSLNPYTRAGDGLRLHPN
jgi:hypothetical protein